MCDYSGSTPKGKVLLVDDQKQFVRVLSERMKAKGLRVEVAYSGQEALKKVACSRFDAILLDLVMPGLDGIETLKLLKSLNPELQIIMLTGHATIKTSVKAMKLGAMDFLEKTVDIQELLFKIEEASIKTALLNEKRIENELADILRRRV